MASTILRLIPLPPAVGRAIDRAIDNCAVGPILLNSTGRRMDRHAATRRLKHLANTVVLSRRSASLLRRSTVRLVDVDV